MDSEQMAKAARDAVRSTITANGGSLEKRKAIRRKMRYKPDEVSEAHERVLTLTDRAKRQINGDLFKLEPDGPVDPGDLDPQAYTQTQVVPEEMWSRVFLENRLTLEELLPYRIKTAWRIVREMARLKGLIADDEGLDELLGQDPDPWTSPTFFHTDEKSKYTRLNAEVAAGLGDISLLPPEVPEGMQNAQYDPNLDGKLSAYMKTIHFITLYLQIENGSNTDPAQGRYGLFGLQDANMLRLAFPSRLQILAWEELLVDEVFYSLAEDGIKGTETFLKETYGLRPYEIMSLIKLAKGRARIRLENDLEEDRAIMVFRLEDLIMRSRECLDLRVELGALKQMALVMGLGRTDPEDSLKDFIDVVGRVSKRQQTEQSASKVIDVQARPAGLIEGG